MVIAILIPECVVQKPLDLVCWMNLEKWVKETLDHCKPNLRGDSGKNSGD